MTANEINETGYKEISLLTSPITTVKTLTVILYEQFIRFVKFLYKHKLLLLLVIIYISSNFVNGPHQMVKYYED